MTWAILIVLCVIIGLMIVIAREQVPWGRNLRRIHTGIAGDSEWMASTQVKQAVQGDYHNAMNWLQESGLKDWSERWRFSSGYLSGMYLHRYQEILKLHKTEQVPRFIGLLRCSHRVEIRNFSDDGERCLVVDYQSDCRMATYDGKTKQRVMTQDLGESILVYEMAYDKQMQCWKIDAFIQELPRINESSYKFAVRLNSNVPPKIGRDN